MYWFEQKAIKTKAQTHQVLEVKLSKVAQRHQKPIPVSLLQTFLMVTFKTYLLNVILSFTLNYFMLPESSAAQTKLGPCAHKITWYFSTHQTNVWPTHFLKVCCLFFSHDFCVSFLYQSHDCKACLEETNIFSWSMWASATMIKGILWMQ